MKKISNLLILILVFAFSTNASNSIVAIIPNVAINTDVVSKFGNAIEVAPIAPEFKNFTIEDFLKLTPSKYKALTGKSLGVKKSLQLKIAQKFLKKRMDHGNGVEIPKIAYVIMVLLGLGWLAMGLMDNWTGNNWWMNLILTALCWLPGVIHGFIKMREYYNR